MAQDVPPVPYKTKLTDQNGLLTVPWIAWFRQILAKVGGNTGVLLQNPMTTAGDMICAGSLGTPSRVAGSTSATKQFLTQTGTGSVSASPSWNLIVASDLPTITLTGDVTGSASGGSISTTIASSSVTNAKMANMANNTVKGNTSGNSAAPSDLALGTMTEATSSVLTLSNWTNATLGSPTILVKQASGSQSGYLSSTDWTTFNNKQTSGNYITALTGDGSASGPGSASFTLATVNSNTGSFGSSTAIPSFTVNAKGLITAASTSAVVAPAGTLTGTTLASNVVTSSLTTVGTIGTGVWQGTAIAVAYGGTGLSSTSQNYAFMGPTSGSGAPSFRAIVAGDIPTLNQNTTGTASNITASSNSTLTSLSALTTASSLVTVGTIGTGTWQGTKIGVAYGGTGLASGTSGGILGFTSSSTLASSGALTANQLVIGGGAGSTPSTLAAGSQYQVLVMGASNPSYGQVNLGQSAAITGTLPIGNGGTGQTTANAALNALLPSQSGNSGKYLTTNGTSSSWASASGGSPTAPTIQQFTSGSGTYTTPTSPSPLYIVVEAIGGGGAGANGGGGNIGATGGNGGDTTFGSIITCNGGSGGVGNGTGGGGGSASVTTSASVIQTQALTGGSGSPIVWASGPTNFSGANGASTPFGGEGQGSWGGTSAPNGGDAVANTGAGGGGGGSIGSNPGGGGGGAGGYAKVLITSPSSTYSYAVGSGGASNSSGAGATAGGNGASGQIIVWEYYQ